jgi:hypothetical protein
VCFHAGIYFFSSIFIVCFSVTSLWFLFAFIKTRACACVFLAFRQLVAALYCEVFDSAEFFIAGDA